MKPMKQTWTIINVASLSIEPKSVMGSLATDAADRGDSFISALIRKRPMRNDAKCHRRQHYKNFIFKSLFLRTCRCSFCPRLGIQNHTACALVAGYVFAARARFRGSIRHEQVCPLYDCGAVTVDVHGDIVVGARRGAAKATGRAASGGGTPRSPSLRPTSL